MTSIYCEFLRAQGTLGEGGCERGRRSHQPMLISILPRAPHAQLCLPADNHGVYLLARFPDLGQPFASAPLLFSQGLWWLEVRSWLRESIMCPHGSPGGPPPPGRRSQMGCLLEIRAACRCVGECQHTPSHTGCAIFPSFNFNVLLQVSSPGSWRTVLVPMMWPTHSQLQWAAAL